MSKLTYWFVSATPRIPIGYISPALASTWAVAVGGFVRIEAWVDPDNTASQHVLTSAGFDFEGRPRSFLTTGSTRTDALVYSRVTP